MRLLFFINLPGKLGVDFSCNGPAASLPTRCRLGSPSAGRLFPDRENFVAEVSGRVAGCASLEAAFRTTGIFPKGGFSRFSSIRTPGDVTSKKAPSQSSSEKRRSVSVTCSYWNWLRSGRNLAPLGPESNERSALLSSGSQLSRLAGSSCTKSSSRHQSNL